MTDTFCTGCSEMFLESALLFTDTGRMCSPCAAQVDIGAMGRAGRRSDRLAGWGLILMGLMLIALGA